jgi:3-polyprenyl-4-hydroxybenzoate decarboxylase
MMSLAGKKIVLGISGGIAAYKAPELVRRLRDRGADVRVAMTEAAKAFITPPAGGFRLPGFRQSARPGRRSRNGPY